MLKPINVTIPEKVWPLPKVSAITLWPFIVYRAGRQTPAIEAHELYHWNQAFRWGVILWYAVYLALLPFYGGGRNHPLERPAYAVEDKIKGELEHDDRH